MLARWTGREKVLLSITLVLIIALGGLIFGKLSEDEFSSAATGLNTYPLLEMDGEESAGQPRENNHEENDFQMSALVVDVKGAVHHPGLYTLSADSRVWDAIQQAGGTTAEATTLPINLAQPLVDGMVIYVPNIDEIEHEGRPIHMDWNGTAGTADGKVNINMADSDQLQQLPGIGPARAEAIIRYREEHGPFSSVEELTKVSGIGPKTLEAIREQLSY